MTRTEDLIDARKSCIQQRTRTVLAEQQEKFRKDIKSFYTVYLQELCKTETGFNEMIDFTVFFERYFTSKYDGNIVYNLIGKEIVDRNLTEWSAMKDK